MTTLWAEGTESPPMDEIQLAQDASSNVEAFAELYRRHVTRVYRYHIVHTVNLHGGSMGTTATEMNLSFWCRRSIRNFYSLS